MAFMHIQSINHVRYELQRKSAKWIAFASVDGREKACQSRFVVQNSEQQQTTTVAICVSTN